MTKRKAGKKEPGAGGSKPQKEPEANPRLSASATPERFSRKLLMAASLFLLVFAAFSRVLRNDFVNYDDPAYVVENFHVQSAWTWQSVEWAFRSTLASNWHPLTWLSHMLDFQIFGLHPWGHHLTNLLLHAINAGLLFWVLRRMTGATWRSWFVAALFGLHPQHVESVAWVAERKDVLSTLFWLLALCAYARYAEEQGTPREPVFRRFSFYFLCLFFFIGALMSKPMVVTLPCVLLLLDYWPLNRMEKNRVWPLVLEKLPFFLLAAASSIITIAAQKAGKAVAPVADLPLIERLENAAVSYAGYLGKLLFPANLAVFYPYPAHWPLGEVIFAGVLLLCISVFVIAMRRQQPFLLIGWLWFFGTLVPVIGLVQVGSQAMADRYSYVPSIGMFIF